MPEFLSRQRVGEVPTPQSHTNDILKYPGKSWRSDEDSSAAIFMATTALMLNRTSKPENNLWTLTNPLE